MVQVFSVLFLLLLLEVASALSAKRTNAHVNASREGVFMITSGISSSTELCMSVENGLLGSVGANLVLVLLHHLGGWVGTGLDERIQVVNTRSKSEAGSVLDPKHVYCISPQEVSVPREAN
jgi:hypothetical protein